MLKLFGNMMSPSLGFAQEGAAGGEAASGGDAGGDGGSAGGEAGVEGEGGAASGGEGGDGGGSSDKGGSEKTPDYSTPEGFLTFARENGAFESADKYQIPTTFEGVDMPEHLSNQWDIKSDASMFAQMAAKHGLTQTQAEGVFKDYVTNAIEISTKAEAESLEAQKPEVIMKQVYGDKAAEAMPALERGLKALNIDASKGLRTHHAMKAIAELGRLVGEDGHFRNEGAGGAKDEEMSTEEWLKSAMN
ncbi:hypothetical protein [Halodesulfovibrio aestuarii]|uniref:Uncharacterized protein n=1 Tax=Halodesulfovibrio aestuarii TaxID=126333 RepID=A0ABV4JMY2_9BACT